MPKHVAEDTDTTGGLYLGNVAAPGAPAAGSRLYANGGTLYGINTGGAAIDVLNQGFAPRYALLTNTGVYAYVGGTGSGFDYVRYNGVGPSSAGITVNAALGYIQFDTAGIYKVHFDSIMQCSNGAAEAWVAFNQYVFGAKYAECVYKTLHNAQPTVMVSMSTLINAAAGLRVGVTMITPAGNTMTVGWVGAVQTSDIKFSAHRIA